MNRVANNPGNHASSGTHHNHRGNIRITGGNRLHKAGKNGKKDKIGGPAKGDAAATKIKIDGKTIKAGDYDITVNKDEVIVRDRKTGKEFRAWGDPHLTTGDGDRMSFTKDNLTIDLPGGVKLTIKPTPEDANGVAWIDQVAVMAGTEGVVAEGVHSEQGPTIGAVQDAGVVDELHGDGTVLSTGAEIDDVILSDGTELTGGDPTARWGEHNLDGRGGTSKYNFTNLKTAQVEPQEPAGNGTASTKKTGILNPNSDYAPLMTALADLDKQRAELLKAIENPPREDGKITQKGETDQKVALLQLQDIDSRRQQLNSLITNLMAQDSQTKLSILRNLRNG